MTEPKTIVRPDDRGKPDDIVVDDVSCFRLERMDKGRWWLACYRGDQRICFSLSSKSKIECVVTEDDFGAEDDSAETDELIAECQWTGDWSKILKPGVTFPLVPA